MIKQPEKSSLCGQCCLATILNITLDESIKLIGHKGRTRTTELTKHFQASSDRLSRTIHEDKYSLCRVHFKDQKNTHWVLLNEYRIYDPVLGEYVAYEEWLDITCDVGAKITSGVLILQTENQKP